MGVTNYNTYNGRIRSESTAGVITSYLTDALGSVTATVNQSQVVQNTYRYKPYGATLAKTGSAADPAFLYTGDTGSRPTGLAQSGQYNRKRHYDNVGACWTSVDPLWPAQLAYAYAGENPVAVSDPSGLMSACTTIALIGQGRYYSIAHWPHLSNCFDQGASHASCREFLSSDGGVGWSKAQLVALGTCLAACESEWDPWSLGRTTSDGHAWGLMQIKPRLWDKPCSDWGEGNYKKDPCSNIRCGMAILCLALETAGGDWHKIGLTYACTSLQRHRIENCLKRGGATPG